MLVVDVLITGIFFSFFSVYLDYISREKYKIYQRIQK